MSERPGGDVRPFALLPRPHFPQACCFVPRHLRYEPADHFPPHPLRH